MASAATHASVAIAHTLLQPFQPVLDLTQASVRTVRLDFWTVYDQVEGILREFYARRDDSITATLKSAKVAKLTVAELNALRLQLDKAIQLAVQKPFAHLTDQIYTESGRKLDTIKSRMLILDAPRGFDLTEPGALPDPRDASDAGQKALKKWRDETLAAATHVNPVSYVVSYRSFYDEYTSGRLLARLRIANPALAQPALRVGAFNQDHGRLLRSFWIAASTDTDANCALIASVALRALSIPLSQALVERSFSILSNREIANRLLAGSEYLINNNMLAINRPYLYRLANGRAEALEVLLDLRVGADEEPDARLPALPDDSDNSDSDSD
jgi:hypothetical protein